ncbi:MAG TPA: ketosynthase chain-length factor [Streptosporangiaceae bacterium]|jgi:act minimal PKS chain-length factor (CLF/KS beta)
MTARSVITGLGVVAPNGIGAAEYWQATLAGRGGIGPITRFDASRYPTRLGGVIRDFDPARYMPSRLVAQTDLWSQYGLAATALALRDAGLDVASVPEFELGVVTASSSGGNEFGQREIQKLWGLGPECVGAYQSIAWFYAATTGQLSIAYGARGPCGVLVAEQAAGLDALGQARRAIRTEARVVISGGTEAPLSPYALVCQLASGQLSDGDNPRQCFLPFDCRARGHVPGEGGAILIVEDLAAARARGARVYGEIAGYAAGFDQQPDSGRPAALAATIRRALADAAVAAAEVDVVFADAAAVPALDRAEAAAIEEVFGTHAVPVTAPKTMTGRLYAGGAPLDVAAALLAIRDGVIPPTVGVGELADGCRIDLVRDQARPAPLRTALVLARGFGGFTAALILTAAG